MPGVGGYFRPDDPLVAQRRALQWAGVGDILRGGSGAGALQGIQQLQQQQAGQELLGGLLGGAPTGGTPPFVAPGSQRAQPLSQPSQVTTTAISDDPIVQGAADAINRSGDPTLALIRGFEGFRETPYWDVNALRTGYGSDTITLPSGEVQRVTEGTRVSREDAERDLVRRVRTEFAPRARQDVSPEVYDSLNPQQQAALNSLAYNYGKVPERVARVARTGDVQATAQAIAGLASDNEGVNASRRRREAQLFAGGAGAAPQQAAGQQIDPNRLIQILQHPGIAPETKQFVLQRYGTQQQPELTTAMREYQLAQSQGFDGTFLDYQTAKSRAGATTVNVGGQQGPSLGKLSTDFGYVLDPETGQPVIDPATGLPTAAPVPGTPAALEAQATERARAAAAEQTDRATAIVKEDIGRARELAREGGAFATGLGGSVLANVPGSQAYDLGQLTQTIRANIGFDRLQQMREASPTGGALGAIAVQELQALQAVLGSLDTAQSQEQFLANLDRLEEIYTGIQRKAAAYPNAAQYGFGEGDAANGGGWQDLGGGIRIREKQ